MYFFCPLFVFVSILFYTTQLVLKMRSQALYIPFALLHNTSMRIFAALILATAIASTQTADELWRTISALDAGPSQRPNSAQEASTIALTHLAKQRVALDKFVRQYPDDARTPRAFIRLANVIAAEGHLRENAEVTNAALKILRKLQTSATASAEEHTDAAYWEASIVMQSENLETRYRAIAEAAEKFAKTHPSDRRAPHLLAEAATVCDADPALKRSLLSQARSMTADPALLRRIDDDTRRFDMIGKKLDFSMPAFNKGGAKIDASQWRGQPTLLVFWSAESAQSLLWLNDLRSTWKASDKYQIVTVAVDTNRREVETRAKAFQAPWLVAFDGKGWESPAIRALGINTLPNVWIIDAEGIVRSVNAKTNWQRQLGEK